MNPKHFFYFLDNFILTSSVSIANLNAAKFTQSKAAWKKLFGTIFKVSPDRIVLEHNESSSEITVQVSSRGLGEKHQILNLMKNGSEFKSSIETEQAKLNELEKFDVTEVSSKPKESK